MLLTTQHPQPSPVPLVLDLDGTLIRTDTFHEMMVYLLIHKPLILLRIPFWLFKGRAYAKAQLVGHAVLNLETLPYNKNLLFFAQKEFQEGRSLILATGTDQRLAQKISDHLGIFQEVIGSNGDLNMTGHQKRKALLDRFGVHGFDYAGDSPIDTPIWEISRKALVVCPKWGVLKKAGALKDSDHIHYFSREIKRPFALFLALRPLFWVLNLMSTSLNFFLGLSFLSSGLLILGDLFILELERKGLCNNKSVFAKGHFHLVTAFILAPLLISSSLFFIGGKGYIGVYILFFMGLDRFTRYISQSLRWMLLGLFQLFAAFFMGL